MSEPISVEARVDELSKPGNEAELAKVLNEQFNDATNPADSKPADGTPPETKPAPADNQPAPADPADNGDPSKPADNNAGDPAKPGNNRYQDLLADRNQAKEQAANAQTEVQILTKQVADLTAIIQKMANGQGGEGAGDNNQPAADDPNKGKSLEQIVEETIAKREAAKNASADAEKSITDQIQALNNDQRTPNAAQYAADIKAIMEKHPTLNAYAAYRMLQGEGVIPTEGAGQSNANKTSTGNRSKSNLLKNKKPEDMSQAELEAHLRSEQRSGGLVGLV